MSLKLDKIVNICPECGGEGVLSACCNYYIEGGRCLGCGRYCRTDGCHECDGSGVLRYVVGAPVQIFVSELSNFDLQLELDYAPEKDGESKTFEGKISDIVDNWQVKVRIGRRKYDISIVDLVLI